jgi:hypothetical protein
MKIMKTICNAFHYFNIGLAIAVTAFCLQAKATEEIVPWDVQVRTVLADGTNQLVGVRLASAQYAVDTWANAIATNNAGGWTSSVECAMAEYLMARVAAVDVCYLAKVSDGVRTTVYCQFITNESQRTERAFDAPQVSFTNCNGSWHLDDSLYASSAYELAKLYLSSDQFSNTNVLNASLIGNGEKAFICYASFEGPRYRLLDDVLQEVPYLSRLVYEAAIATNDYDFVSRVLYTNGFPEFVSSTNSGYWAGLRQTLCNPQKIRFVREIRGLNAAIAFVQPSSVEMTENSLLQLWFMRTNDVWFLIPFPDWTCDMGEYVSPFLIQSKEFVGAASRMIMSETPILEFGRDGAVVSCWQRFVDIPCRLSWPCSTNIRAHLEITGGSASNCISFANSQDGSIEFEPGQTYGTCRIVILPAATNNIEEQDVVLAIKSDSQFAESNDQEVFSLIIKHHAVPPAVFFAKESISVPRGAGVVNVPLKLSWAINSNVAVKVACIDCTATNGGQFALLTNAVTFAAGEEYSELPVEVFDQLDNPDLPSIAALLKLDGVSGATLGDPFHCAFSLTNRLAPVCVDFAISAIQIYVGTNSAVAYSLPISLSSELTNDLSVQVIPLTSGSAEEGVDYSLKTNVVRFAAGEKATYFPIDIYPGSGTNLEKNIDLGFGMFEPNCVEIGRRANVRISILYE